MLCVTYVSKIKTPIAWISPYIHLPAKKNKMRRSVNNLLFLYSYIYKLKIKNCIVSCFDPCSDDFAACTYLHCKQKKQNIAAIMKPFKAQVVCKHTWLVSNFINFTDLAGFYSPTTCNYSIIVESVLAKKYDKRWRNVQTHSYLKPNTNRWQHFTDPPKETKLKILKINFDNFGKM